jgi:acyl-coenzyme A thioesterase PaaI-like protein
MEITEIPFNKAVGIERSELPDRGLVQLGDSPRYHNHLGTVHAAAQFALAEACSGEYLLSRFPGMAKGRVGVVRKAQVKFSKPARGKLYAQGRMSEASVRKLEEDLNNRGRAFTEINVEVTDSQGVVTMTVVFEWYIQALDEARGSAAMDNSTGGQSEEGRA